MEQDESSEQDVPRVVRRGAIRWDWVGEQVERECTGYVHSTVPEWIALTPEFWYFMKEHGSYAGMMSSSECKLCVNERIKASERYRAARKPSGGDPWIEFASRAWILEELCSRIGPAEVAHRTGIPVMTIRHWDKQPPKRTRRSRLRVLVCLLRDVRETGEVLHALDIARGALARGAALKHGRPKRLVEFYNTESVEQRETERNRGRQRRAAGKEDA